jgi:hypothetical protein
MQGNGTWVFIPALWELALDTTFSLLGLTFLDWEKNNDLHNPLNSSNYKTDICFHRQAHVTYQTPSWPLPHHGVVKAS